MQTQKELIKNKIRDAALEEFLIAGYTQSSMRNIALQAGITVGNIYSYFSSKDDLFDSILQETVDQLQEMIRMEIPHDGPITLQSITEIAHFVSNVFLKNRIQFLILMDGSGGSKYQNIKGSLITLVTNRFITESQLNPGIKKQDPLLAEAISVALIEGMIYLFKKSRENKKKLERLIVDYLTVVLGHY